jgi:PAS domain-containing protein/DNA-binding CsgD family transcriptional regulator
VSRDIPTRLLDHLVRSIYETALEPERWESLLAQLIEALGCRRGGIGLSVDGRPDLAVSTAVELDPDILERWGAEFGGFDPFLDRYGGRIGPTGTAVRMYEVVRPEDVRGTDVFRAIYEPLGIDDHLVTVLGHEHGQGAFFAAYRALGEEPFRAHECELHRMLSPHLVLAARIHSRLAALTRAHAAQAALVERLPFGLLMLDETGRVVEMNPAAEQVLARGDALVVRRSRIEATVPRTRTQLEQAIGAANELAVGRDAGGGAFVQIERYPFAPAYSALVVPISGRSRDVLFGFEPRPATVVLVISDPDSPPLLAAESLRRTFGLPPALARLAAGLCSGKTLAEHAEDAEVTVETVRKQMKDLMGRLGVRRQAEVVQRILSSVAQLAP